MDSERDLVPIGLSLFFITLLVGFFLNEFMYGWFSVPNLYYIYILGGSIGLMTLVSVLIYSGEPSERVFKGFRAVYLRVPWSLLSLFFSILVFTIIKQPVSQGIMDSIGPVEGIIYIVFGSVLGSVLTLIILETLYYKE